MMVAAVYWITNSFYKSHGPMVLIIHLSMTIWISNMEMEQQVVALHWITTSGTLVLKAWLIARLDEWNEQSELMAKIKSDPRKSDDHMVKWSWLSIWLVSLSSRAHSNSQVAILILSSRSCWQSFVNKNEIDRSYNIETEVWELETGNNKVINPTLPTVNRSSTNHKTISQQKFITLFTLIIYQTKINP